MVYSSLWETHLRATECHLPRGIIQRYLPPGTGERAPSYPQPCRPVLDLPILQRNGRLRRPWWLVIYRDGLPVRRQSPIQVVITR